MKSICSDDHMPDVLTVWRWRHEREDFCKLIQRAREAQSEAMIDACQELADEAAKVALDPECGSASVAAKKLAIETRLKVAARFAPEKFGDRVRQDVAGVPGAPLERKSRWTPSSLPSFRKTRKPRWKPSPANSIPNPSGHGYPSASFCAISSASTPIHGRWRPSRRCLSAS